MSAGNKIVITLVGRTGDGKSTLGNELLKCLGMNYRPFAEMNTAEAGTGVSSCVELGDVVIVDNPGLVDPSGLVQDKANIATIVRKARELGHLNMLVLVVNSQAVRFDEGMQNALRLISDSFRAQSLEHLFVVYTKCLTRDDALLRSRTEQLRTMINTRCGTSLTHLTFFAVENHPENYRSIFSADTIARMQNETRAQLNDLLRAAHAQTPYWTTDAQAALYEHARQLREEQAARAEAEARAAAEVRRQREIAVREEQARQERERQRRLEQEREWQREQERQRERERQERMAREREVERKREVERQRQREIERQREIDAEQARERQRQREREEAEERQRQIERDKGRSTGSRVAGGATGAAVGAMVAGPVGAVVGAVFGGGCTVM